MKKLVSVSFVFVLILGLLLVNVPQNVIASGSSSIADGTWNTGTEVTVDLTLTSAPGWLQLLTNGVKISAPARICHPFRGGQFGWVGEIRQLVEGKWVRLSTTNDWIPSKEGTFTSCAQAPAAGTYALFGYYSEPKGIVVESSADPLCNIDMSGWIFYVHDLYIFNRYHLYAYTPGVDIGTEVTFSVVTGSIIGTLLQPGTNSGIGEVTADTISVGYLTNVDFDGFYGFYDIDDAGTPPTGSVILSASNCQVEVPFTFTEGQ